MYFVKFNAAFVVLVLLSTLVYIECAIILDKPLILDNYFNAIGAAISRHQLRIASGRRPGESPAAGRLDYRTRGSVSAPGVWIVARGRALAAARQALTCCGRLSRHRSGGCGDRSASDRVGAGAYVDAEPLHHLRGELRRILERYKVFVQFVQVQERPVAVTAAHICTVLSLSTLVVNLLIKL